MIKSFSALLNTKRKDQKKEIYQDENLELFKEKFNTISILMKFFSIFDIIRANFFSFQILKLLKELMQAQHLKAHFDVLLNCNFGR